MEKENKIKMWDDHLDEKYGKAGTPSRTDFEIKAHVFIVGEILKEERTKANLTQAQLAERTGKKKAIFPGLKMDGLISNFQHFID